MKINLLKHFATSLIWAVPLLLYIHFLTEPKGYTIQEINTKYPDYYFDYKKNVLICSDSNFKKADTFTLNTKKYYKK